MGQDGRIEISLMSLVLGWYLLFSDATLEDRGLLFGVLIYILIWVVI